MNQKGHDLKVRMASRIMQWWQLFLIEAVDEFADLGLVGGQNVPESENIPITSQLVKALSLQVIWTWAGWVAFIVDFEGDDAPEKK